MRSASAVSRFALVAAASLMLPAIAFAQTGSPKAEGKWDNAGPTMIAYVSGVRSEENKKQMIVNSMDIRVNVRGSMAETTVTLTFLNPTDEELEGEFALNMARGAVVTGYALDIDGELIDGVLETKYKAAEAYQRRVARRVDPGLAEVDYSDRFETRIFPIVSEKTRTIRLSMASAFDPIEGYVLPLTMPGRVGKVSLSIDGDVRVVSVPDGLWGQTKKFQAENVRLNGALKLAAAERASPMMVSRHPKAERFFELVGAAPSARPAKDAPLHIFWDRSVSRADDALKDEAQLAEDFAKARKQQRVKVTLFDSGRTETREIEADRLAEELGAVRYRGGTSYASLKGVALAEDADCVMFSDGRVSIDDRRDFSLSCRMFTVASGPEVDRAWLSDISQKSGGVSVELGAVKPAVALDRMKNAKAGILAVTDLKGKPIEFVQFEAAADKFHIAGPVPSDGAVLVRFAGERAPKRFDEAGASAAFTGPGALWARHRLGVVASDTAPDKLAEMARRYNVATPQASFVVLEAPSDYVDSDIAPPANYPKELMAEYRELRREADEEEAEEREGRAEAVAELWDTQKEWWNTKFSGERAARAKRASGLREDLARPAPATEASADFSFSGGAVRDSDESDRVMVTGSVIRPQVTVFLDSSAPADGEAEEKDDGSIEIELWKADRPYLKRLNEAGANWEAQLDKEMKDNSLAPVFWFDVAEWHWSKGRKEEARRAVEAALDMPTRDNQTLAIVAARLLRYGSHDRAIWLLERLAERETDRPQPIRTLGLALVERSKFQKNREMERADLKRAVELLAKAATQVFDVDSTGVEEVTLMEANAALARLKRAGGSSDALDRKLVANLEADVRVVMEWNTPRTDLDLWMTEPNGDRVGYSSPISAWGGKLSGDVTNGYGPEEYVIRKAVPGVYEIHASTFASDRTNPNGPSSLTVRVIRNFGRPNQTEELIDVEMDAEDSDERSIGKIRIG